MAWSDLPAELLHRISSHLPVVDYIHLTAVCIAWNSALANNTFHRIQNPPSPWLLLPSDAGETSDTLTFRDLTVEEGASGRHRRFSSVGRHISGRRFIGSKDGWLVTLDKRDLLPRLFNPLTKAEIFLPSLLTIPADQWQRINPQFIFDGSGELFLNQMDGSFRTGESFREAYFNKIVVSSNDPFGTAVVIYGYKKSLALARAGDQAWVHGPQLPPYNFDRNEEFQDVYYHEEERRFYAITRYSAVLAFDADGQNVTVIRPARLEALPTNSDCRNYIAFLSKTILKINRDIHCIDREIDGRETWKTKRISVYKFVPTALPSSQWVSVKDLGGFSLFIGCNQTFSLHHKATAGLKPNCIYFSDHWEYMSTDDADRDAGVFDLHNGCFEYFLESDPNWPPSIWFMPQF